MIIYSDTHIHCYQMGMLGELLSCAHQNFSKQCLNEQGINNLAEVGLVLFFTNSAQDNSWVEISLLATTQQQVKSNGLSWQLSWLDDSLIQAKSQHGTLLLAPARQINSVEKLEFLLLGCTQNIIDKSLSAEQIIQQYSAEYALICPWGVGKWLGARGKIVNQLIESYNDCFQLGDNGGRPWFWHHVPQFKLARGKSLNIINGSDPLPIANDIQRAASYGIHFSIDRSDSLSLAVLLQAIKNPNITKHNYGSLLSLKKFIYSRWALFKRA